MIGEEKWVRLVCKCRPVSPGYEFLVATLHESHVKDGYVLLPSVMREIMGSAKCRVCGAQFRIEERP